MIKNRKIFILVLLLITSLFLGCSSYSQPNPNKYLKQKWHQEVDKDKLLYSNSDFGGFHGDGLFYAVYSKDDEDVEGLHYSDEKLVIPNIEVDFMDYLKERLHNYEDDVNRLLNSIPDEYKINFDKKDYYWYYESVGGQGRIFILYDMTINLIYYYVIVM